HRPIRRTWRSSPGPSWRPACRRRQRARQLPSVWISRPGRRCWSKPLYPERKGYVLARGDDMIKTAEADVVCPAVTADAPDRFLYQVVGDGEKQFGGCVFASFQGSFQLLHPA